MNRSSRRRWAYGALGLVVLAGAIGGGWWQMQRGGGASDAANAATAKAPGGEGKDKPAAPLSFLPTEVTQPETATLPTRIEFSGPLVAPSSAQLRSRAGGTLAALTVAEGDRVRAGQVVGRVEAAETGTRVDERRALLESARASLTQAERAHASNERLAAQEFISPNALDNSRAALDTARANLGAAQASLATAQVAMRETTLAAPISGIVAKRHLLPGEKVSAEQAVLSIVDLRELEVAGLVGTHEVGALAPGMVVRIAVEGVAEPIEGELARIAPAAEAGTRSIGVAVRVANPKERLRAGQYAIARVELADPTPRLVLPAAAVGTTGGQAHVWVIENGALVRRAVTLGRRDEREGRVEVLSGITPGAQVLAARFDNLREGAKAGIAASGAAPVAGAAKAAPVASAAASQPQPAP